MRWEVQFVSEDASFKVRSARKAGSKPVSSTVSGMIGDKVSSLNTGLDLGFSIESCMAYVPFEQVFGCCLILAPMRLY